MNTSHLTDKELVTRVLTGHPDLFGPLVERHIRAAHAIAYARLGNTADAEDAVQEAFLHAYEKLATLRDPARFAAWLLTIARHEASRIAAKRNRAPLHSDQSNLSGESDPSDLSGLSTSSIHPDPAQHEMNAILRDHVMRLPEPAREVLLLHYFAGHSAREIAALLDLRRTAVLKRLQRAREQLAETLLRDLEAVRPSTESLAPQVARIVALAAAIKLTGVSAAPVAAAAATFTLASLMTKVPVVATLIATAGIVIGYSILTVAGSSTEAQDPANRSSTTPSAPAALAEARDDAGDRASPAAPLPETPPLATGNDEVIPAAITIATEPTRDDQKNLTGLWRMWGSTDQDADQGPGESYELTQRGVLVSLHPPKDDPNSATGEGRLLGDRLTVTLRVYTGGGQGEGYAVIKFEGPCKPSSDEFELRGTMTYPEYAYSVVENGKQRVVEPQVVAVSSKWRRVSSETLSEEAYIRARREELRRLAAALMKFPHDNGGRVPQRLEELLPVYLSNLQPYRPEAGVSLKYTPVSPLPPITGVYPQYGPDIIGDNPTFGLNLNMQERFIAVENTLRAYWGDRFLGSEIIVEAVYDQFGLTLVITEQGSVGTPDEVSCIKTLPPAPPSKAEWGRSAAMCQNNMKQAGLSLKMFEQEAPDKRLPAGWLMIYPEYMPDRCIMVCPGASKPEMSYELLFPAVTGKELEATYDALFGKTYPANAPGSRANMQSRIPIVIEINECSSSGGRNVLFLDGHTEHIKGRLEDNPKLAPFLNLH